MMNQCSIASVGRHFAVPLFYRQSYPLSSSSLQIRVCWYYSTSNKYIVPCRWPITPLFLFCNFQFRKNSRTTSQFWLVRFPSISLVCHLTPNSDTSFPSHPLPESSSSSSSLSSPSSTKMQTICLIWNCISTVRLQSAVKTNFILHDNLQFSITIKSTTKLTVEKTQFETLHWWCDLQFNVLNTTLLAAICFFSFETEPETDDRHNDNQKRLAVQK